MTDSPSAPAPRFCTSCGAALPPNVAFCGTCGARVGAPAPTPPPYAPPPANVPPPGYAPAGYAPYAPAPRASFPTRWLVIAGLLLIVAVTVVVIINVVGGDGGGFSSGPTKEDIAQNANAFNGLADDVEILRKEKCKLTDLDKSRGYTEKWIIEWRDKDSRYAYTASEAWAFDGYNWDQYFASESKTGCP